MPSKTSSMVFLQYLTTVFDNIQDVIMLVAVEPHDTFRLLVANKAFHRSTGHTDAVIGKTMREIVSPTEYKKLLPRCKKVCRIKRSLDFTDWYDVPIGKQIYEVKLMPVLNAVGECVQIACICRNVTELYQLQQQIKETAETLEQTIYNLQHKWH